MATIYCYSFVEDEPSAAVVRRLVSTRNAQAKNQLIFHPGFPAIMNGCSEIRKKCHSFIKMAKAGLYTLTLTDLDSAACAGELIRTWFQIPKIALPKEVIFRVAVREIESWILADHIALSRYIQIAAANFSSDPDTLKDPKQHLLGIVRKKGKRKIHKEMLPEGSASIGPRYNEVLCDFVRTTWCPNRAARRSPSLDRAIKALLTV